MVHECGKELSSGCAGGRDTAHVNSLANKKLILIFCFCF